MPGSDKHLAIRRTIRDIAHDLGIDAWIAEYKGLTGGPWTEIVDACIDSLLSCHVYIAILYRRAGNPMPLGGDVGFGTASFLEIELFYASLRIKPAFFFLVRGYEPEPELENLIRLLKLRVPSSGWFIGSEAEIERRIRELFAALASGSAPRAMLPNFCDLSADYKSFRRISQEVHSERLSLLDRLSPVDRDDYSPTRIDHLLTCAKNATSRTAQLSRLWMSLRELSKRCFDPTDSVSAAQWLTLSRMLPSIAAWLGLHGPVNIGVIAAYQTQNELRRHGVVADEGFPYGGFASESYSIGINHARPSWKRLRFRTAERLASQHVELHPRDPSGALAIRGSARLRLARLGRPWLIWEAISDFRKACVIREQIGATPAALGEALLNRGVAEYAASHLLRWRRQSALNMMREGVRTMEAARTPATIGAVVSAKRKLASTLEHAGLVDEALMHREEAAGLASEFGIIGQLGRLQGPAAP